MAKTRKPVCRLPADLVIEPCGSTKAATLCIGDRVQRKHDKATGIVMGVHAGRDNRGKGQLAARVCFDRFDAPGDLAYPYLFSELRKLK